jgi:hypothetical protein
VNARNSDAAPETAMGANTGWLTVTEEAAVRMRGLRIPGFVTNSQLTARIASSSCGYFAVMHGEVIS